MVVLNCKIPSAVSNMFLKKSGNLTLNFTLAFSMLTTTLVLGRTFIPVTLTP